MQEVSHLSLLVRRQPRQRHSEDTPTCLADVLLQIQDKKWKAFGGQIQDTFETQPRHLGRFEIVLDMSHARGLTSVSADQETKLSLAPLPVTSNPVAISR